MTEAETKAADRAERMKEWFTNRELPDSLQLGKHEQLLNPALYVKTAIDTLNHSTLNSNLFRAAYFRLYRLKKELEQHEQKTKI